MIFQGKREKEKRIKEDLENFGLHHVTISNLPADFFRMSKRQLEKLFEYASDAFIAKIYNIPQQQIKKRRDDFGIKQLMNTLKHLEIEEACMPIFKENSKIMSNQYNNGNTTHTNSTPINSEKEFVYMKATGIVRRIDDLGRVVIPKEIRRTMRIREGDPLEIYTSGEGEVIFRKYSPMGEMNQLADEYAQVLHKIGGLPVVICDKDRVIAVAGIPKKEMIERKVSPILEQAIQNRKVILDSDVKIKPVEGVERYALVSYPIISSSDVCGAVMYVVSDKEAESNVTQNKLIESAAMFIGKQMEV